MKGKEHMVCKLKKSLYGLEQAPRQWYKKFDSFMVDHGYTRTNADHCVYVRKFPNGKFVIKFHKEKCRSLCEEGLVQVI